MGLRPGVSTHDDSGDRDTAPAAASYIVPATASRRKTKQMPSVSTGLKRQRNSVILNDWRDCLTVAIGGISLERAPAVPATGVGKAAWLWLAPLPGRRPARRYRAVTGYCGAGDE